MSKQILTGTKLREKLLSGVEQLANPVTITLGPKGRNVGIDKDWIEPVVLHDGVSVAKEIQLPDPFENMGAQLVRQAAAKTADTAGDGTTTSTLLAYSMIKHGFDQVNKGVNPMIMKKGMEKALTQVLEYIDKKSKEVKEKEEIAQVATISSADSEIGNIIAEAIHKVGKDGVITSEVHAGLDIQVEFKEGMEFDKGYQSSQFVNQNGKDEVEIEHPLILITDHIVSSGQEIAVFLERAVKGSQQKEIVIIADRIEGAAMLTLLANQARGNINAVTIFAPAFADRRKEILEDIAVLTGGKFISKESGLTLDKILTVDEQDNVIGLENLGRADLVWCNDKSTRIVGGFGKPEQIEERAKQIRKSIKDSTSDFDKEKLQERLAKLISGAAIIKVGARTEVELSDRKERVIDAVEATKAAVLEGIVPGAGLTFLYLGRELLKNVDTKNVDEMAGYMIMATALSEPYAKILSNAGVGDEIKNQIDPDNNYGYNVVTEEFGDLFKMGVIDPTRVTKQAIQNATSVASMILTMEAGIVKIPEDKKETNEK